MNISWHLLFEQLQHNPELAEEDMELLALSTRETKSPPASTEKEATAMQKLQKKLGNMGFQKLLAQQQALLTSHSANGTQQALPVTNVAPGAILTIPSPETKESENKSKTMAGDHTQIKTQIKPEKEPSPADSNISLGILLPQFMRTLPEPDIGIWELIAELFDNLTAIQQYKLVSILVKRIHSLPEAEQQLFIAMLQRLQRGLGQSAFVAALGVQLLSLMTETVETHLPEEPEE